MWQHAWSSDASRPGQLAQETWRQYGEGQDDPENSGASFSASNNVLSVTSWLQDLSGLQFINWLCQWTLGVYCCLEYFFLLSKIDWQRLPVSPVDFSYQAQEPHAQFLWLLTSFPEDSHLTRRGLGCYPKWPMADWGGVATGSVSLPLGRTTLVLYLHTNIPCGISQKLRFSKTMVLPSFSSHSILFPFLSYRFFLKASISKSPVQTPLPQVLRPGNPG